MGDIYLALDWRLPELETAGAPAAEAAETTALEAVFARCVSAQMFTPDMEKGEAGNPEPRPTCRRDRTSQFSGERWVEGGDRPSWPPDGQRIAFASLRDENSEIYVMNADGSGQTRLTDNPAADGSPSWSPQSVPGSRATPAP